MSPEFLTLWPFTSAVLMRRRISNRESARRLRKQRSEKLTTLMTQQDHLNGISNGLASHISTLQRRLHTLTCENRALLLLIGSGAAHVRYHFVLCLAYGSCQELLDHISVLSLTRHGSSHVDHRCHTKNDIQTRRA